MAKLAFTKLGLKPKNEIVTLDFNGQTIEIKQYLSTEKKNRNYYKCVRKFT